ncbi:hypothetical protein [Roseococcus sp.]|uniref:hypothetical protein n=1 Tax=Roseococcus sp. TaxID=2109646 RepID=UPI003BAC5BDB
MLPNSVEQTTPTTGTGTYSLTAPTDPLRQSFVSGVGSGKPVRYRCTLDTDFEEGWGLATAGSPDTLTRNVTRSSNGNALVNWPAGTKRIYCPPDTDALRFGAVGGVPTATGTANAHAVAHFPPLRGLLANMGGRYYAPAAASTGSVTLAIDSLTALPLRRADGSEIGPGVIRAGQLVKWYAHSTSELRLDEVMVGPIDLGSATLAGGTSGEITIPAGYRSLEIELNDIRNGSGAIQLLYLQVKVGGLWLSGAGTYYDGRTHNTQSAGQQLQPLAAVAGGGNFLGWMGANSGADGVGGRLWLQNILAPRCVILGMTLADDGVVWNWSSYQNIGLIEIASGRIEAVRVINLSGSPRAFVSGTMNVTGLKA